MRVMITVVAAEPEHRTTLSRPEIFLIWSGSRTIGEETVQLREFLALFPAATSSLSLLGLKGPARQAFPAFCYITYNQIKID